MKGFFTIALCVLVACYSSRSRDDVVARVGEAELTADELAGRLTPGLPPEIATTERARAIDHWIRQELLYQEALIRKLDQQARLALQLAQTHRDLLVAALLDAEFASEELDFGEGDIHRYYNEHQDQFRRDRPEIKARHILLASHRDANARRQALKQGTDFAAVAREYSLDIDTRYRGGNLGYFSEADEPALWAVAHDLKPNTISKPIRTVYGYHLIEILEHGDVGTVHPIEEVRIEIVESLVRERHQTRLDQFVTRLKDNADWAITDSVPPTAPIDAGTTSGI